MPSQRTRESQSAQLLAASIEAARAAASLIGVSASGVATLDWRTKQRADFVTDVDTGAELRIREVLGALVPNATVLGEELSPGVRVDEDLVFIVDPLDGTTNFLHGYPEYAVSIGAVLEGDVVSGVVLNVPHGELFTAQLGHGAFRNGEPIHVSACADPSRALVGTGFPFKHLARLEEYQRQFAQITRDTSGMRRAGSAALDLCNVACGRFDAFWELNLAPWDIAAGLLLIREAGGRVSDLSGRDIHPAHTEVAASNGVLHAWLLSALGAPAGAGQ